MQQLRNNRVLTIILAVALVIIALMVFNLTNVLLIAQILQSLAITALCVVGCLYLAKRI